MTYLLEINDLKITFETRIGKATVVDDFDLKLKKGEKVGIIGESGSGKTSLALSIMGLNEGKIEGSIMYQGEELLGQKETEYNKLRGKKISMVFQNTGEILNPVYTLIDQVMEPYLEVYPYRKIQAYEKACYLLKKIGLNEEQFYSYPFYLSGGEVQRGMIAMALINDPDIVILDEPTSALDVRTGESLMNFIKEMMDDKTLLVISHDLSTVAKLTEKLAVLYAGIKLESGPTNSVLNNPAHPYTRALVRAYPTGDTIKDLQGIRGSFPSIVDSFPGCPFYGRCTQSLEKCGLKRPSMYSLKDSWDLACHRRGVITLLSAKGVTKTYPRKIKRSGKYKIEINEIINNEECFLTDKENAKENKNISVENVNSEDEELYFNAVDNVDIELKEGEILVLVGESGSGKTTLGHIIAGVNEPTSGQVYYKNNIYDRELYSINSREKKEIRQSLQLLFQDPYKAVSHRLMVCDIIEEPLKIQGVKDKKERTDKIKRGLNLVGLPIDSFFTHKYPHELSGGELQRVTIARALVQQPKVLIADEPSASLDASVQAKILKLLMELQNEEGFSLLLITHNIALAGKVGDRMAVMYNGKIVEEGQVSKIFKSPEHPYTKTLLQLIPCLTTI